MKIQTKTVLLHVAGMVAVLGVGLHCNQGAEKDHPEFSSETALLVSDRDALQVCLDLHGRHSEANAEAWTARLEEGLAAMQGHRDWEKARYGHERVRIARGCPAGQLPDGPLSSKDSTVGPGVTEHPSPFRLQIRVVDDELAKRVLGDRDGGRAAAEFMKVGHDQIAEVSSVLVLRPSAFEGTALTDRWLPIGLGLEPLVADDPVEEADTEPKKTEVLMDK